MCAINLCDDFDCDMLVGRSYCTDGFRSLLDKSFGCTKGFCDALKFGNIRGDAQRERN